MSDGTESKAVEILPAVGSDPASDTSQSPQDEVHHPAKVMRIATMVRTLLDEVKAAPLDEASRARVRDVYETSVKELSDVLSEDLRDELARLSLPFDDDAAPTDAELRIAHAQLVGWLEGLFHGIQAMLFAQQMEGRQRLMELRPRGLPPGGESGPQGFGEPGPGQYL